MIMQKTGPDLQLPKDDKVKVGKRRVYIEN